jgi:hypothetical protein
MQQHRKLLVALTDKKIGDQKLFQEVFVWFAERLVAMGVSSIERGEHHDIEP